MQPTLKEWGVILSHLFLQLFAPTDVYFLWTIIQYHFIFLLRLFQFSALGALSGGPCVPLAYPHQCFCFILNIVLTLNIVLLYFLALQDA